MIFKDDRGEGRLRAELLFSSSSSSCSSSSRICLFLYLSRILDLNRIQIEFMYTQLSVPDNRNKKEKAMPSSPPSPKHLWFSLAVGFAAFWMFCLYYFVPVQRGPLENSSMSEPAEYNWTLLDLKDQPVPFSKFKGKTVFLNFWATWCPPCVREMPSIAKLMKNPRLRGMNIAFVCVSTDKEAETVRIFLEGVSWDMSFLRTEKIPAVFMTDGIPATFLIAPDGRIAATAVGAADWNEPHVVEFLEKLAGPPKVAR